MLVDEALERLSNKNQEKFVRPSYRHDEICEITIMMFLGWKTANAMLQPFHITRHDKSGRCPWNVHGHVPTRKDTLRGWEIRTDQRAVVVVGTNTKIEKTVRVTATLCSCSAGVKRSL
jgi:hypothetical protein